MKMNWKVLWKRTAVSLGLAVIACIVIYQYRQEKLSEALAGKIIRFHVLANSDSKEDQDLKLKVRDAVGAYMHRELGGASKAAESRQIIEKDMEEIVRTAENAVEAQGYSYPVYAALLHTEFPKKTYGDFTFPEGEYEALQIKIGEGKGKNWWCVMYPNMCFSGSVYEVVEEEAEESLRQVLTAEEYKDLMENKTYKVKFKWLSFLP